MLVILAKGGTHVVRTPEGKSTDNPVLTLDTYDCAISFAVAPNTSYHSDRALYEAQCMALDPKLTPCALNKALAAYAPSCLP